MPSRKPFDLDTSHPFTTAQALAAGITAGALRGPKYRQLRKGVYVAAETPVSAVVNVEAALLGHTSSAFGSHFSAARVYNLPLVADPREHVSVFDPGDRRRRAGVECHVAAHGARVLTYKGVRVSAPVQTFIELASYLTLVDLVVVGDAIVRKGWYTPEELRATCRASQDPHADHALRAAEYVRTGVDSPMETRLRMLIMLAGLPEPEVNFKVLDEYGNVVRRFDLSYPNHKLIVEYDGRQHAEDAKQYDNDIARREELDDWKWRIVVVTSAGIYQKPEETLLRVRKALKECGAKGLPTRLSDAWRPHFPISKRGVRSS